jgi:hypothetical protein
MDKVALCRFSLNTSVSSGTMGHLRPKYHGSQLLPTPRIIMIKKCHK